MTLIKLSPDGELENSIRKASSLLLDFDGTLVDYYDNETRALSEVLDGVVAREKIQQVVLDYREINELLWRRYEQKELTVDRVKLLRFEQLSAKYGIGMEPAEFNHRYLEAFCNQVRPYPGVVERLQRFRREHPDLKVVILTNGTNEVQRIRSARTGLDVLTDGIISSDQAGIAKPNSEIFKFASRRLDIDLGSTFMVGDSLSSDIQGAVNSGIPSCYLKTGIIGPDLDALQPKPDLVAADLVTFLNYFTLVRSSAID